MHKNDKKYANNLFRHSTRKFQTKKRVRCKLGPNSVRQNRLLDDCSSTQTKSKL